jgi:uncharacterized protein
MVNALVEVLLQAAVLLGLAAAGALAAPRAFRWRWMAFALLLVIFHDALLLRLYGLVPALVPGRWNWSGKLLATIAMLAIAALPWLGWRRCGITWRQARDSGWAWVIFGVLASLIFCMAFYFGDGRSDRETILFQWSMPGIQEELFYRGVLLLALNEAFRARTRIAGIELGWGGVLATVAFGLIHSLFYGAEGISFDALAFAVTAGPSFLLLWFREKTGSIVLPVLAHNVANGAFTIF